MGRYEVNVPSAQAAKREQKRRNAEIREAAREAAFEAALRTLPRVSKDSPVDRGQYKAGWDVKQYPGDKRKHAALVNDSPIAGVIENGTRPFWAPLQPLIEWVMRKFGEKEEDAYRIARAVQGAIAARGLRAHKVLERNMPFLRKQYRSGLQRRIQAIASRGSVGNSGGQ